MRRLALWLVILVFAAVSSATAQTSAGGSVRGTVRDEQGGVLPGVTITATSPNAVRPSMTITDAQGYYRLSDLQPGPYMLTAQLDGFTKYERMGIEIHAALNIDVDIPMKVGSVTETVQVIAETPMLEVQKPVQAINITGDMQRQLPLLAKRDWSGYLEVTPSVASIDNGGGYSQVYMVRGTDMEGHVFQLDGTDIGSFRQARADAIQLSTEAIQDVQVKTGGLDASAPLGVGVDREHGDQERHQFGQGLGLHGVPSAVVERQQRGPRRLAGHHRPRPARPFDGRPDRQGQGVLLRCVPVQPSDVRHQPAAATRSPS